MIKNDTCVGEENKVGWDAEYYESGYFAQTNKQANKKTYFFSLKVLLLSRFISSCFFPIGFSFIFSALF